MAAKAQSRRRGRQNVNKRMKKNQPLKTYIYNSKFCHLGLDHFPTINNGTSNLAHKQIVASCSHMKFEETTTLFFKKIAKNSMLEEDMSEKKLNQTFKLKKNNYFIRQVRVLKSFFFKIILA